MTDSVGPHSRPSSAAAGYAGQGSMAPSSPRPSVTSRGSVSSLRRQAAIAASSASASMSPPQHQQPQQPSQPTIEPSSEPSVPILTQLFTTLTTTSYPWDRRTKHYPTVHYLFADDDPDILTEAIARHDRTNVDPVRDLPDDRPGSRGLPPSRAVLLDIVPSTSSQVGYEVVSASSLTSDWAVLTARVSGRDGSAGTLQGGPNTGSLVLEIEGVSIDGSARSTAGNKTAPAPVHGSAGDSGRAAKPAQQEQETPSEELSALVDEFEKGMGMWRQVVNNTEAWRQALERVHDDDPDGAEEETQMPEEETQRAEEYTAEGKGKSVDMPGEMEDAGEPNTG